MAKKRRTRTRIRTAAGTVQEQYLARIRALRDDPMRILPEPIGPEAKPLVRLRRRLERIASGKVGMLDRRDKGIVGAVANILDVAEQEKVPRLVDQKMAGKRRFFLQRGHVPAPVNVGVQNHDDPLALLAAYRPLAKQHALHVFAGPGLWCSGTQARPPPEWVQQLTKQTVEPGEGDHQACPHDGARVALGFHDGPSIALCQACAETTGNLHQRLATRYAGPHQRRPVDVWVRLPDGSRWDPPAEEVAGYRGGVHGEDELIRAGLAAWHQQGTAGRRYILGDEDFGDDQDAFLDRLAPHPWERTALAAMTADGHAGAGNVVDAVLREHREGLAIGVAAILEDDEADARRFLAEQRKAAPRELLRIAHEEATKRARLRDLPDLEGLGPVGSWVHGFIRTLRAGDRRAAMGRIGTALDRGQPPRFHLWAFLEAAGGDLALEARFSSGDREAAAPFVDPAKELLEAGGKTFRKVLTQYLRDTGSGERLAK